MFTTYISSLKQFVSVSVLVIFAAFSLLYAVHAPRMFVLWFHGHYDPRYISSILFLDFYTFLCFLAGPALLSVIVFREKLTDIGLRLPKKSFKTIFLTCLALSLLLPLIVLAAKQPQFRLYYAYGKINVFRFAILQILTMPIYYFCEEFFFRGFLFLTLWKRIGWHSYWINDILFFVAHLYKPPLEMLMAIPVGIVLCWLVLETRSIFPCVLVHMSMGLLMNVLVNFF